MFVAALAVPDVFDGEGVLFGAAFLVVCAMHVALYALAGRGSRDLLGAAPTRAVDAARRDLDPRRGLHGRRAHLALARCSRVHVRRRRAERVDGMATAPVAFAERHGLVLIIALGEAFISIGIAQAGSAFQAGSRHMRDPRAPRCLLVLLAYFDFFRSAASGC